MFVILVQLRPCSKACPRIFETELEPKKRPYRNYLKERPCLNESPFEREPLFTSEKFNEHPGLNECLPQNRKGVLI